MKSAYDHLEDRRKKAAQRGNIDGVQEQTRYNLDSRMRDSLLQAIKGLPERQIANDIEGYEVEPLALLVCETISLSPGVIS